MADKTLISCLAWIKKGYAKEFPLTNTEMDKQMTEMMEEEELMNEAKMYKEKYENDEEQHIPDLVKESNIENQNDDGNMPFGYDDSDEEKEDYKIEKTDNMFVVGKIEDEFAAIEVYVYEPTTGNLFVHHDIMLSSFPLCLDWLPVEPSSLEGTNATMGNYAIVGTFYPDIEIWNLDVLDAITPTISLAGIDANTLQKKKKQNKKKNNNDVYGHTDAVSSLQLNQHRKNMLASGSADSTIKVWDLIQCKPAWGVQPDGNCRVEMVSWHPTKEHMLLSVSENK